MAYLIKSIEPVLKGQLLRVTFSEDAGPDQRAFFTPDELKRKIEALNFWNYFPVWLRAQADDKLIDLKTIALAELRTFCVGKVLPATSRPASIIIDEV